MTPADRRREIVKIVLTKGRATVEELSATLDASKETIRRDLTDLAHNGKIDKFHGGATLPSGGGEGPFRERMIENAPAKVRIASAATALFHPGETLFVDTGSTTLFFAENLASVSGLTVITNSSEIARIVSVGGSGNKVFLIGGAFHGDNRETVGSLAVSQIQLFRAHHVVLTVAALNGRSGAMDFDLEEALIARAMIEQAERVTVLVDSSKFDHIAAFAVCPLERIDTLVSDKAPRGDLSDALKASDVRIVIADPGQ